MGTELVTENANMPASFAALTERQKLFVIALLKWGSGKGNRKRCAKEAGYTGDDNTLRVTAYQLFHDQRIQKALHEVAAAHLGSYQLFAVEGIADMAEGARDESVKLKALLALADRTGFAAAQNINVKHEDVNRSEDQLVEKLVALCMRNPTFIDRVEEPRKALVRAKMEERLGGPAFKQPGVIEGEIVETEDDPDAAFLS